MRSTQAWAPALIVALLSIPLASCTYTTETGTKPGDTLRFLEALGSETRDKYPDSTLLAESQKVCDALAKGQTQDQAKAMIAADLGVDSGRFFGAIEAGNMCSTPGK